MKKLFTLLFVGITAIAAYATDYNVPITVTVNDVTSEQNAVLTVAENDGLYDITLKNFILQSEDGPMGVGNVELKGIQPYQDGNATLLFSSDEVTITDGDDPSVSVWMASMLPPVKVLLRGKIEGDHLRCYLDIDLTESLSQVIQVAIGEGYQLPNQGFESWHTSADNFAEPNGWHSFESASGAMASLAGHHIDKSDDAHSGNACARIFATSIFGIIANGTMTTGRMNAGSMSAADPANNAYLDMSLTDVDANGDPFYIPLNSRPDSLVLWVQFHQGTASAEHPYASVSAVITDGTYYQDPEDKEYTNVVAKAKNNTIAVTGEEWQRLSLPFEYVSASVQPRAILITISTNADPGQGSAYDEVLIDNISLVYNSRLSSLDVKGFQPDVFQYVTESAVSIDNLAAQADGQGAYVLKSQVDDSNYAVTVYSGDLLSKSVYTIQVSVPNGISDLQRSSSAAGSYQLDGRPVSSLRPGQVYIVRQADGTIVKKLHTR